MINKFKGMLKSNSSEEVLFPPATKNKNHAKEGNTHSPTLHPQPLADTSTTSATPHTDNQVQTLSNTSLNNIAHQITTNTTFMQMLAAMVEPLILHTLETRYDFAPTDKLKQFIEDNNNELNRINIALEDKTSKLALVEDKIALALQDIAPKISKMLTDVAHTVLHNTGTNSNKSEAL